MQATNQLVRSNSRTATWPLLPPQLMSPLTNIIPCPVGQPYAFNAKELSKIGQTGAMFSVILTFFHGPMPQHGLDHKQINFTPTWGGSRVRFVWKEGTEQQKLKTKYNSAKVTTNVCG